MTRAVRRISRALIAAGAMVAIACGRAPLPQTLDEREQQLDGGRALILSVREPVSSESVEALISEKRDGRYMVRVFTYRVGATPGRDQPAALYEFTVADGFSRKY